MIKIKHFKQTENFCGPASLRMVLDFYGKEVSEKEIGELAISSVERGTSADGIIKAAKSLGFKTMIKKNSSIWDLKKYIKKGIPVIVDWFLIDDGHYSVVIDVDDKNVVLVDPALDSGYRKIEIEKFLRIWFDFPGNLLKRPEDLVLRLMLIVLPEK